MIHFRDPVLLIELPVEVAKPYDPEKFVGILDHFHDFLTGKSQDCGVYESLTLLAQHRLQNLYVPATADTFMFGHITQITALVNNDHGTHLMCHAFDLDQVSNLGIASDRKALTLGVAVTETERLAWQERSALNV